MKEKLRKDGYDYTEAQALVDKRFGEACEKIELDDGSVLYQGIEGKDYFTEINIAFLNLRKQDWFGAYCCLCKWLEDDEYEENLLVKERKENSLFRVNEGV